MNDSTIVHENPLSTPTYGTTRLRFIAHNSDVMMQNLTPLAVCVCWMVIEFDGEELKSLSASGFDLADTLNELIRQVEMHRDIVTGMYGIDSDYRSYLIELAGAISDARSIVHAQQTA